MLGKQGETIQAVLLLRSNNIHLVIEFMLITRLIVIALTRVQQMSDEVCLAKIILEFQTAVHLRRKVSATFSSFY